MTQSWQGVCCRKSHSAVMRSLRQRRLALPRWINTRMSEKIMTDDQKDFLLFIKKTLQNPPPLGGEECVEELRNYVRFWELLKTRKHLWGKSLYNDFSGVWSNWKSWIQNEGLHTLYGKSRLWRNKSFIRKTQKERPPAHTLFIVGCRVCHQTLDHYMKKTFFWIISKNGRPFYVTYR